MSRTPDEQIAEWIERCDAYERSKLLILPSDVRRILDALVAERDVLLRERRRADDAEARIAKTLDLIGDWRRSELPEGHDMGDPIVADVRDRLRGLYAALDGEVQS